MVVPRAHGFDSLGSENGVNALVSRWCRRGPGAFRQTKLPDYATAARQNWARGESANSWVAKEANRRENSAPVVGDGRMVASDADLWRALSVCANDWSRLERTGCPQRCTSGYGTDDLEEAWLPSPGHQTLAPLICYRQTHACGKD